MAVTYKQRCMRCKKNYVMMSWKQRYALCYDCQKGDMKGEIKDSKMKKFFKIPEGFYRESSFLRSIKINYLRFGRLTDKQIAAFKKVVKKMREEKKEEKQAF